MIKVNKVQLRNLIRDGISTEELNSRYDYSHIIDMSYLCEDLDSIVSVPFLDTKNVIDMRLMFSGCTSLKSIPTFDTSRVYNMDDMLKGCTSLKSIPTFDASNVTEIEYWNVVESGSII